MKFYIAGEGPSDLCDRVGRAGLLADVLLQLAEALGLDNVTTIVGVSHQSLKDASGRSQRPSRQMLMRGNKRKDGVLAVLSRKAEALARHSEQMNDGEEYGAVLFSDCDFTNSQVGNPDCYHRQVVSSIEKGFAYCNDFQDGVAMVPKMRSESWLLCKYQQDSYASGDKFEKLPANDRAPNCAKNVLARFLDSSVGEMYDLIRKEDIDWTRINCSSFNFFRRRYEYVLCRLAHRPVAYTEESTLICYDADV